MQTVMARGREVAVETRRRRPAAQAVRRAAASRPLFVLPEGDPYQRLETIEMSLEEWNSIPKNPRQRNEEVRIEKNRAGHLLEFDPKHREVALALLPDGSRYKVDGHTRTAVWANGLAGSPATLIVDVYACADISSAQQLYDRFDNTTAAESGTDRVTGAYRQAGISPQTPILKSGEISTAVRQLYHYVTRTAPKKETKNAAINEGVLMFAREIELLDEVQPTRALFPSGIIMGALITLRAEPENAAEFWSQYATGSGTKHDKRMDSVEALHERRKVARKKTATSDTYMMSLAVAAVGGFAKGTTYTVQHGITGKTKDLMRKYAERAMAKGSR